MENNTLTIEQISGLAKFKIEQDELRKIVIRKWEEKIKRENPTESKSEYAKWLAGVVKIKDYFTKK